MSVLFTVSALFGVIIAKTAWRMEEALGRRNFFLLTGLTLGIPAIFYGIAPLGITAMLFLLISNAENLLDPLMGYYINRELDSQYRATANSFLNIGFNVSMVVFFPILGYSMDNFGYSPVFVAMGLFGIALTFLSVKKFRKMHLQ